MSSYPLLIDSTYRNRSLNPHASNFIVNTLTSSTREGVLRGAVIFTDVVDTYTVLTTPTNSIAILMITGITSEFITQYIGAYVEVLSSAYVPRGSSIISGVSADFKTLYLKTAITGTINTDIVLIRQLSDKALQLIPPAAYVAGTTDIAVSGSNSSYIGCYIRNITSIANPYSKIVAFTAPNIITIYPALSVTANYPLEIYRKVEMEGGIKVVREERTKLYEIKLDWIKIPRHSLFINETNNYEHTINNYPYIGVELSGKNHRTSELVTNNITLSSSQFIVPITDTSTGVGKFYTFYGSSSIITALSVHQTIHFTVLLPDGTNPIFDPDDEANILHVPNPDLQISALFTLKEICKKEEYQ